MQTRNWPLGLVIPCEVLESARYKGYSFLVCKSEQYPGEAFMLFSSDEFHEAVAGDRGTLTVTAGGPTGQYFVFTNDSSLRGAL